MADNEYAEGEYSTGEYDEYGEEKGYNTIDEYTLPNHVLTSTTEYNKPGLPTPPAGWGKISA